jgi:hypothetical protein
MKQVGIQQGEGVQADLQNALLHLLICQQDVLVQNEGWLPGLPN